MFATFGRIVTQSPRVEDCGKFLEKFGTRWTSKESVGITAGLETVSGQPRRQSKEQAEGGMGRERGE